MTTETLKKIQHLINDCEYGKIDTAYCLVGIKDAMHTAQPQPEVTDDRRKAALDRLDFILEAAMRDAKKCSDPEIGKKWHEDAAKTIRLALSAPSVQEVTVEEISQKTFEAIFSEEGVERRSEIREALQKQKLRIVRGEEEK